MFETFVTGTAIAIGAASILEASDAAQRGNDIA